jgi:prepilin-type N-terminal cleavage/methylation domain-containing protein
MRQTAAHRPYVRSTVVLSGHSLGPAGRRSGRRLGFTLIELVVAMAILLVVVVGVLSAVAFAYTSSNDTEMRNTAKNIATYTLEYLRARTVTRGNMTLYNQLNPSGLTTGTYAWYVPGPGTGINATGALPGMIDVGNLPLQSNGYPCNYTSSYVRTGARVDGQLNPGSGTGIAAGASGFKFSSKHAAGPTQMYATQPLAFTTTLQGYVSLRDTSTLASTQNPAPEDKNLACLYQNGSGLATGVYRTLLTDLASVNAWTSPSIVFPGRYPSGMTSVYVQSFTPLAGYVAKVYTTDADKVDKTKAEYNPYYTNVAAGTQAYRGFRVLTQIVARTADTATYNHVQYYDVTVTVLWMNGTHESTYELVSRIIAY